MALFTGTPLGDHFSGTAADDTVDGLAGDDTVYGWGGADVVLGGEGNDHIDGGNGHDRLEGGPGNDAIFGGGGNDTLLGGAGNDRLYTDLGLAGQRSMLDGGEGDDQLVSGSSDDSLLGGAGNDFIESGPGQDFADGGSGDDRLSGDAGDTLIGGTGNDRFRISSSTAVITELAGQGIDEVTLLIRDGAAYTLPEAIENVVVAADFGQAAPGQHVQGNALDNLMTSHLSATLDGGAGNDTIIGGGHGSDTFVGAAGDDSLDGGVFADHLDGGAGDDSLFGGSHDDTLLGGDGDDSIDGGSESDLLRGGAGDDELLGGHGNDTLDGGTGFDILEGGYGDDTYLINALDGGSFEEFGQGDDTLIVGINGAKLVTDNIEHVLYVNDAAPLAYWVDALVSGYSWQPIGTPTTLSYAFLTSDSAPGFQAFSADDQDQTRSALALWTASTQLSLVQAPVATAQIVFRFADLSTIEAAGVTEFDGERMTISLDIEAAGGLLQADTWWTHALVHEIGHALWLKHPGNYNGVDGQGEPPFLGVREDNSSNTHMSYEQDDSSWQPEFDTTLRPFDIAAAQWLYGVKASVNAGNTSHRFSSLAWPNTLIADGSGIDTLDASDVVASPGNSAADLTLDLRPGTRSYTGAPRALITDPGQVSINYGTLIEHAIGSAGRDDIFGNDADNSLRGAAGNDTLHGSAGNDTLDGGEGDDSLDGGPGRDQVLGGNGADRLFDSAGGGDWLDGGAGNDVLTLTVAGFEGFGEISTLRGGAGDDSLVLRVNPAALSAANLASMISARAAFASAQPAPGLGLAFEGLEHLAWADLAGTPIVNFAPRTTATALLIDEDAVTQLQLAAVDFEGDTLRYELLQAPYYGRMVLAADGSLLYTPNAEYWGFDQFTYRVSDASGSDTRSVPITVRRVDDAPTVVSHTPDLQVKVGELFSEFIERGFSDIDSLSLTPTLTLASGAPLPAWLHFDPDTWRLSGTPGVGDAGVLRLRLTARGEVAGASDEFVLGVASALQQAPVGSNGVAYGTEDQVLIGHLPAATDAEGDALSYDWYFAPNAGQLEVAPDGSFRYTPAPDFSGSQHFQYDVSDGRGGSSRYMMELRLAPVNDPATGGASIDVVSGPLQVGARLIARSNFTDPDGINFFSYRYTWMLDGVAVATTLSEEFYPGFAAIGKAVSVKVSFADNNGHTESATSAPTPIVPPLATLNGSPGADLMQPYSYTAVALFGGAGNDTLIGGAEANSLVGGDGNDVLIGGGGIDFADGGAGDDAITLAWLPYPYSWRELKVRGGPGDDTLILQMSDQSTDPAIARDLAALKANPSGTHVLIAAGIDVAEIEHLVFTDSGGQAITNFRPVAVSLTLPATEDQAFTGRLPRGIDIEGDALSYHFYFTTIDKRLTWFEDGSFSFTPDPEFSGWFSFDYYVSDGQASSPPAQVTIQVAAVNDAPTRLHAMADRNASVGTAFTASLANNHFADVDNSSLALTASLTSGAALPAWLAFDATSRRFSGTPDAGDVGVASVRVTASDGELSVSSNFLLGVQLVPNQLPQPTATSHTGFEDEGFAGTLAAATDADGDALSYTWESDPPGVFTLTPDGRYSYTPPANLNGTVVVPYLVSDGRGGSALGELRINLSPVNDPPQGAMRIPALPEMDWVLNADTSGLIDPDGIRSTVEWIWLRDGQELQLGGDSAYYRVPLADWGHTLGLTMRYLDGNGTLETVHANTTAPVGGYWQIYGSYYGNDRLTGTFAPDVIYGNGGNDTLEGGAQNDQLLGGWGWFLDHEIDTAVYAATHAQARLSYKPSDHTWTVTTPTEGSDTLWAIERLQFTDVSVALDLDGNAGTTAKIIGAVFGKPYLANKEFVGIGLQLLDGGMSYTDLVSLAIGTDFFKNLAGASNGVVTNTQFVKLIYANVVGAPPSDAELAEFVGLLNSGAYTQASLAHLACETAINQLHIDLVGLASTGMEFTPAPGA